MNGRQRTLSERQEEKDEEGNNLAKSETATLLG